MPPRTPKACRQQGCGGTSTAAHGYCPEHEHIAAEKKKAWSTGRAGRGRGGRPWRRKRDRIKARANGLCEECLKAGIITAGRICDHIIPTAEGGTDSDDNLQWLCQSCSDRKTQEEAKRARQRSL